MNFSQRFLDSYLTTHESAGINLADVVQSATSDVLDAMQCQAGPVYKIELGAHQTASRQAVNIPFQVSYRGDDENMEICVRDYMEEL